MPETHRDLRFYGVCLSNRHADRGRPSAWHWGPPLATAAEAKARCRAEVESGRATLAVVVRAEGDARRPLPGWVYPAGACRVIDHYLELLELCRRPAE